MVEQLNDSEQSVAALREHFPPNGEILEIKGYKDRSVARAAWSFVCDVAKTANIAVIKADHEEGGRPNFGGAKSLEERWRGTRTVEALKHAMQCRWPGGVQASQFNHDLAVEQERLSAKDCSSTAAFVPPGPLSAAGEQPSAGTGGTNARQEPDPCRHSADFRSVHWFNTDYTFTSSQAAVVGVLWIAWENGTPDVGQETILAEAKLDTKRLPDLFKGHRAWGTMIVSGETKGAFRLQKPAK